MTTHEIALSALLMFFVGAFCFVVWQRDQALRLYRAAKGEAARWKTTAEFMAEEGKSKPRVQLFAEDRASPALREARRSIEGLPSCFGSRPGAQHRAENGCDDCPVNQDCLSGDHDGDRP